MELAIGQRCSWFSNCPDLARRQLVDATITNIGNGRIRLKINSHKRKKDVWVLPESIIPYDVIQIGKLDNLLQSYWAWFDDPAGPYPVELLAESEDYIKLFYTGDNLFLGVTKPGEDWPISSKMTASFQG